MQTPRLSIGMAAAASALAAAVAAVERDVDARGEEGVTTELLHNVHAMLACYVAAWEPALLASPWAEHADDANTTRLRLTWASVAYALPRHRCIADWLLANSPPAVVRYARREYERRHGPNTYSLSLWQCVPLRDDAPPAVDDVAHRLRAALTERLATSVGARMRVWALHEALTSTRLPLPTLHPHLEALRHSLAPVAPRDRLYLDLLHRALCDPAQPYGGAVLCGRAAPLLGADPGEAERRRHATQRQFVEWATRNRTALQGLEREYLASINTMCVRAVLHALDATTPSPGAIERLDALHLLSAADAYDDDMVRALQQCFFAPLANVFDARRRRQQHALAEQMSVAGAHVPAAGAAECVARGPEPETARDMTLPVSGTPPMFDADRGLLLLAAASVASPSSSSPPPLVGLVMASPRTRALGRESAAAQAMAAVTDRLRALTDDIGDAARVAAYAVRYSHLRDTVRVSMERARQQMLVCVVWDDEAEAALAAPGDPLLSPLWSVHIVWNQEHAPWVEVYEPVDEPYQGWGAYLRLLWSPPWAPSTPRAPANATANANAEAAAAAMMDARSLERRGWRLVADVVGGVVVPRARAVEIACSLASHTPAARAAAQPAENRVFQLRAAPRVGGADVGTHRWPLTWALWYAEMRMRSAPLAACASSFVESVYGAAQFGDYLRGPYSRRMWGT